MQKVRGFEVVSAFQDNKNVVLPKRKTTQSAGYDFASCGENTIRPEAKCWSCTNCGESGCD